MVLNFSLQQSQNVDLHIQINLVYSIIQTCAFAFIIVIMSGRAPSLRKKKPSSERFRSNFIYYQQGSKLEKNCRVCHLPYNLISVCDCNFKYHEKCLLNWIRQRMKRALITQMVFNASTIRCESPNCLKQIHFLHQERYRYGCDYFCQKLGENKCNKHLVLLIVLFWIFFGFVFVAYYLSDQLEETVIFALFCTFSLMSLIVAIMIVGVCIVCFSKYFQVKQIFLKSIVRPKVVRSQDGGSSSSSDENKIYENISQNFQIYVQD